MATVPLVDVDRATGDFIQGWPRCRQSIVTILTTRLRTRVMRLWWGSSFLDMMDKPMVARTFNDGIVAACTAINRYEPEFKVSRISLTPSADGECWCAIDGTYLPDGTSQRVTTTVFGSATS